LNIRIREEAPVVEAATNVVVTEASIGKTSEEARTVITNAREISHRKSKRKRRMRWKKRRSRLRLPHSRCQNHLKPK